MCAQRAYRDNQYNADNMPVEVTYLYNRYGKAVQQILNAALIAESENLNTITIPPSPFTNATQFKLDVDKNSDDDEAAVYKGKFLKIDSSQYSGSFRNFTPCSRRAVAQKYNLIRIFNFDLSAHESTQEGPYLLGIHLRGGNMMKQKLCHPQYVQFPVMTIEHLAEGTPCEQVLVVSEDSTNPITSWCQSKGYRMNNYATVNDTARQNADIWKLMHCDRILLGVSTFGLIAYYFSTKMTMLYTSGAQAISPAVLRRMYGGNVTYVHLPSYIPKGRWAASPEQMQMLIEHKEPKGFREVTSYRPKPQLQESCEISQPSTYLDTIAGKDFSSIKYLLSNTFVKSNIANDKHGVRYAAVALESRYTENMVIMLKQLCRLLNSSWHIILFVTINVYDKYLHVAKSLDDNIHVKILQFPLHDVSSYNAIMLSEIFWRQLSCFERVLVFQEDTMIYNSDISRFLEYDYIGSPWPQTLGIPHCVGNGGFSLRNPNACLECIRHMQSIHIPAYAQRDLNLKRLSGQHPEDVLFSLGMVQMGYNVAPVDIARQFAVETCEYGFDRVLGSHRLDAFNKCLSVRLLQNSVVPFYVYNDPEVTGHRFGWKYVAGCLMKVFDNPDAIVMNTWIDCDYLFNTDKKEIIPKKRPWVGISHLTPVATTHFFKTCDIKKLVTCSRFASDLQQCKGIYTLSTYMKEQFERILHLMGYPRIPVFRLFHPVPLGMPSFESSKISNIDTIISIGCQLRRSSTLYRLNTRLRKVWLPGRSEKESLKILRSECEDYRIEISQEQIESVFVQFLSDAEYDEALSNSFVLIDLYDASANNALIECIARDIPCFVARLPATEEYIGAEYPLLFSDIQELQEKICNLQLVHDAHAYLVSNPLYKNRLRIDNFIKNIVDTFELLAM